MKNTECAGRPIAAAHNLAEADAPSGIPGTFAPPKRLTPHRLLFALSVLLIGWGQDAAAGLPVQPDPTVEARVDSLIRETGRLVYEGRLELAMQAVDEAARTAPGDPRVGLFRYRVLRANYPDDINDVERARAMLPALMEAIEGAIANCDAILSVDPDNAAAYMYRGWAHMMKAQSHAIARNFRSAAFTSRTGKKDFDRFYELRPEGDADAATIMGGFLYFADILPGFVKFLRWLIRVPGGDRVRGLELLTVAARDADYTQRDAKLVLGFVNYMFEGRIEDAKSTFEEMRQLYPYNPRIAELHSSAAFVVPQSTNDVVDHLTRIIGGWDQANQGWDPIFLYRNHFSRARVLMQRGMVDSALADYRLIIAAGPTSPDWLTPLALTDAIGALMQSGDLEASRPLCDRLLDSDDFDDFHDRGRDLCDRIPEPLKVEASSALRPIKLAIYSGDHPTAEALLDGVVGRFDGDFRVIFYQGELYRLTGRQAEAEAAFRRVLSGLDDDEQRGWRIITLMRLGETLIDAGRLADARKVFADASELEDQKSVIGRVNAGRVRYLDERLN